MDNARYSDMRSCAENVGKELDRFEALSLRNGIRSSVLKPLKKRLENAPLRAYFISKLYAYLKACPDYHRQAKMDSAIADPLFTQKIPFVFEVIITIQYLHNQILDGKCGVVSGTKINDNLINANLLKDLLYEYIEEEFDITLAFRITKTVREVFRLVDLGQQVEKNWNTYDFFKAENKNISDQDTLNYLAPLQGLEIFLEKLEEDLTPEHWAFTRIYLQRIYLTCAALFEKALTLMLDLTDYQGAERENLKHFAVNYGIMRQLVNDNADYIPSFFQLSTKGKAPEDALSDLHNRNITLPLIFHLDSEVSAYLLDYLEGKTQEIKNQEADVFEEMLNSFALLKSIQNAKILGESAKGYLNPTNPAFQFIADSCNIVQWNKFIFPCYRSTQYKAYKKTSYYKATKAIIKQLSINIQHEEPVSGGCPSQGVLSEQCAGTPISMIS